MAKEKAKADEEDEVYLKYVIKDCSITINVQDGGVLIFQSGSATPPPPKGGG